MENSWRARRQITEMSDEADMLARAHLPSRMRMLPAAEESEKAVVGAIFLWPDDVLGKCAEEGVTGEWFHNPCNAVIYGTCFALHDSRRLVNARAVTQVLIDQNRLNDVGGVPYITDIACYPTALNVAADIATLREKWQLREVIRIGMGAVKAAYDEQDQPGKVIEEFERDALSIRARGEVREMVTPKESVMQAINAIQDLYERRGAIVGLSTGLDSLDRMTNGLCAPNVYVIAARPSMGKTALAMNIAAHIGLAGNPVLVFSLEMSREQLWQRMLCTQARINSERLRDGHLSERDFPALTAAASNFAQTGIWIDDTSGISIQALRSKARRMKSKHGIKAIFLDYLQLATSNTKRAKENRQQEVSEVSGGLKALAKELELPVVVLAQLNRNPEGRTGNAKGKPRLGDLRESGSVEQDADFVGLLSREEYYADTEEERERVAGRAVLDVAKQRSGPVGEVRLTFLREFTRFEMRAESDDDEPERPLFEEKPSRKNRRKNED